MNSPRGLINNFLIELNRVEIELEDKESQFKADLIKLYELKAEREESNLNVENKEQDLRELERLEECKLFDIEKAEKLYEETKNSVGEKESELELAQISFFEAFNEFDSLQKSLIERSREAESKAKELDSVHKQSRELESVIEINVKRAETVRKEIETKSNELSRSKISIKNCDRAMDIKEKNLGLVRGKSARCSLELERHTKRLGLIKDAGEKMRRSMDQYSVELGFEERRAEKVFERIKEAELEFDDVGLVCENVDESLLKIEQNETSFSSLECSVQELSRERKLKESELVFGSTKIKVEPSDEDQNNDHFEYVHKLIERGEIIHAVDLILQLKLTDKFSPENLLTDYLTDSENITKMVCERSENHYAKVVFTNKIKTVNKEMSILRATIDCVRENNLPISIEELAKRISVLEDINVALCSKKRRRETNEA